MKFLIFEDRKEGTGMKLLMHTCCAPCSVYCIDSLRKEEIEPTVYWYNPNIHPYIEYKTRRDTLREYTKSIGIEAVFHEEYGLERDNKKQENLGYICRNIVDVYFQRKCRVLHDKKRTKRY